MSAVYTAVKAAVETTISSAVVSTFRPTFLAAKSKAIESTVIMSYYATE